MLAIAVAAKTIDFNERRISTVKEKKITTDHFEYELNRLETKRKSLVIYSRGKKRNRITCYTFTTE